MRKLILVAIAGYLWKKFSARHNATAPGPTARMSPTDQPPAI